MDQSPHGEDSAAGQKASVLMEDRRDPADQLALYSVVDPQGWKVYLGGHGTGLSGDGHEQSRGKGSRAREGHRAKEKACDRQTFGCSHPRQGTRQYGPTCLNSHFTW